MRELSPGPAASRYAVVALTASTSRNWSPESGPVMAPGTHVRPPSTVRTQVARCPETHTTLSLTALTACRSAVVWLSCSVIVVPTGAESRAARLWCPQLTIRIKGVNERRLTTLTGPRVAATAQLYCPRDL